MPEKNQVITAEGYNAAKLLALAYGACEKLGWNIKYAGENILVAYTPRSFNRWDMEMTFQSADGQLTVNSKMIHGEAFDMMNRNQKNINQFVEAFDDIKQKADETSLQVWNKKINALVQGTIVAAEQEVKEAAEIDKVMNFSKGNMYLTYGIIAVNLIVFVVMVINGVELFKPGGLKHIQWGTNFTPLTLSGDWWRLLTCNYIHFGLIHVALNMYALYNLGMFLEPMLGKARYFAAYTATGILASLTSLWWHTDGVNSAGASGAIFGLIGLMLAFIVTKYIPATVRQGLLQSVGLMAVYSLVYGLKGGVDNAAHIGGLVAGFIIGYFYYLLQKKDSSKVIVSLVAIGASIIIAFFYLDKNKILLTEREETQKDITDISYPDYKRYYDKIEVFGQIEKETLGLLDNSLKGAAGDQAATEAKCVANWDRAASLADEAAVMDVSERLKQRANLLKEYALLRKDETTYLLLGTESIAVDKLNETQKKISEKLKELKEL